MSRRHRRPPFRMGKKRRPIISLMAMTSQIRGGDGVQSSGPCYSPPRSKRTHCQLITGRLLIFPSSTSAHALYGTSAAAWEVCRNPRCADCSAAHCKLIVRGIVDLTEGGGARGPCQLYCLEGLRPPPLRHPITPMTPPPPPLSRHTQ